VTDRRTQQHRDEFEGEDRADRGDLVSGGADDGRGRRDRRSSTDPGADPINGGVSPRTPGSRAAERHVQRPHHDRQRSAAHRDDLRNDNALPETTVGSCRIDLAAAA
jgi:hypothetical protein